MKKQYVEECNVYTHGPSMLQKPVKRFWSDSF